MDEWIDICIYGLMTLDGMDEWMNRWTYVFMD